MSMPPDRPDSSLSVPNSRAVAHIDLDAIEHNCALLKNLVGERTELCAVVKADGYGHGTVQSAEAALAGGATWLAVATAREAQELRGHYSTQRLLVMGALNGGEELGSTLRGDADLTVWNRDFLVTVDRRAGELSTIARVHIKLDTGMGRLGTDSEGEALELAKLVESDRLKNVELAGLMTHFATADEQGDEYFSRQLRSFQAAAEKVKAISGNCTVHAANSAAVLRDSAANFDMVRCGIAIYGMDPFHTDPAVHSLKPALALSSYVAAIRTFVAGQSAGYGRRWRASTTTNVGILPIGYGDGVRRGLTNTGEVIVQGRRCPIVGTVSMDNIAVDLGPSSDVQPGEPAVLIGSQAGESILVEQVAGQLDTINYEITCGLSLRVERRYHRA